MFGLAALEAMLLLFALGLSASHAGGGGLSGGPEMALFFFVLLPAALLASAVAVFKFAHSRVLRGFSGLAIVAPSLFLLYHEADEFRLRSALREDSAGRGYFADERSKALAEAVVQGDSAKIPSLIAGVDVKQFGAAHETFLRLAMERDGDNADVVAALLRAGADPNQEGAWPNDGGWPLRHAVAKDDAAMAALLLAAGADPNRRDIQGQPAFFEALAHPALMAPLLSHGVRLTEEDAQGWTALMVGVRNGDWQAVSTMLAAPGADPAHIGRSGLGLADVVDQAKRQKTLAGEPIPPELSVIEQQLRRFGAGRKP